MAQDGGSQPDFVIGPDGQPMSLADLPPVDTKRWVIRRKAQVLAAVRGGLIGLEDACDRYNLSIEEFLSWQRMIERHGLPGLRVTCIQKYRKQSTEQRIGGQKNGAAEAPINVSANLH